VVLGLLGRCAASAVKRGQAESSLEAPVSVRE